MPELYPSHPDTLEWHRQFRESRRDGLYSTDSAAILGLSAWGTPRTVYLDKTEPLADEQAASLSAWLGWRLEDSLAQLYAERYGITDDFPVLDDRTYTLEGHPHIKAHLDYRVEWDQDHGVDILLECKTRGHKTPEWGEDGSSKVPVDVWVQVQHEMLCTGLGLTRIPVLFGLRTFAVYEVEADPIFQAKLVERLDAFWVDHVLAKVPPELTGHRADVELAKHYPLDTPQLRQTTPEWEALLRRYRLARSNAAQAMAVRTELEAQLKDIIGTHGGLQGGWGTITYLPTKGTRSWELIAKGYRKAADKLLELLSHMPEGEFVDDELEAKAAIEAQLPLLEGLYTKPGQRTLSVKFSDESEADSE